MSGNPTGSNVVPMPHATTPATAPPQMPMPMPGMWGGGGSLPWGPGCCPPGGMDALLKCYCDVQAATAFICSVMVQCVQTNPAVVQAIIAAIEASGSTLPLIGVTNGSDAQPGQVGEFVEFAASVAYSGASQTVTTSLGVLQPGDWDCAVYITSLSSPLSSFVYQLSPVPVGFNWSMETGFVSESAGEIVNLTSVSRGSFAVPTLIAVVLQFNTLGVAGAAGTMGLTFQARRAR